MSCPNRYYCGFSEAWRCKLAFQKCPEATLEGFNYKLCSTYLEREKNEQRKKN